MSVNDKSLENIGSMWNFQKKTIHELLWLVAFPFLDVFFIWSFPTGFSIRVNLNCSLRFQVKRTKIHNLKNVGAKKDTQPGDWHISGQIIATSHDLTPNGGLVREIPLFQGNLGWWNIIIWPDIWTRDSSMSVKFFSLLAFDLLDLNDSPRDVFLLPLKS